MGLGVDRVVSALCVFIMLPTLTIVVKLEFKTVIPNGTLVTANACQNTDLFFALRGGENLPLSPAAHKLNFTSCIPSSYSSGGGGDTFANQLYVDEGSLGRCHREQLALDRGGLGQLRNRRLRPVLEPSLERLGGEFFNAATSRFRGESK